MVDDDGDVDVRRIVLVAANDGELPTIDGHVAYIAKN
jgi:hypothetical protein